MTSLQKKSVVCLLMITLAFYRSAAVCNCGPGWALDQCEIQFDHADGCGPLQSTRNEIPGAPADVRAVYFINHNEPGLRVVIKPPTENTALARMFDVNVLAMDYPVGVDECFRVKLDPSVQLNVNHTFDLACLNDNLVPRQNFRVTVQPSPTDNSFSNKKSIVYTMPGCNTLGKSVTACANYDNFRDWEPNFKPEIVPGGCNGTCVTVVFDTFHWPNDLGISTYQISVWKENKLVDSDLKDCQEQLDRGKYLCKTTFTGLDPGPYTLYQQIHQIGHDSVYIGTSRFKSTFIIPDPGPPVISGKPKDIVRYTNASGINVNVTWQPPTVNNYASSQVTLTSDYEPGDLFPVGDTEVTYTAVDKQGRTSTEYFTIIIIVPTTPPSPTPAGFSDGASYDKEKLLIGAVSGGASALVLLLFILALKWKDIFKKPSSDQCSSSDSDDSQRRTPTEDTDVTGTYRDRDILVEHPAVIDGCRTIYPDGCDNSHYVCCDEEEFKNVLDGISLDGQIISTTPPCGHKQQQQQQQQPTFTLHITTGPSSPQSWEPHCVENDQKLRSLEQDHEIKLRYDYGRFDSHDSGIDVPRFPNTDVTSISQISGAVGI